MKVQKFLHTILLILSLQLLEMIHIKKSLHTHTQTEHYMYLLGSRHDGLKLADKVHWSPAYGMSAISSVSGFIPLCSVPGCRTIKYTDTHNCLTAIIQVYQH